MAKVLTIARRFLGYHPNAGTPTYFVEKIWNHFYPNQTGQFFTNMLKCNNPWMQSEDVQAFVCDINGQCLREGKTKLHTIRAGKRWKAGELASIRTWSARAYHSNQVIIIPDTEIKRVFDFKAVVDPDNSRECSFYLDGQLIELSTLGAIAGNDGLYFVDFVKWFKFPTNFDGQIICWDAELSKLGYL